ncbi:MAG: hypothetical protein EB049_06210, partial [Actinobacteria bacterium]|nr:hypothetical protein [Actinomycetota bacterium]
NTGTVTLGNDSSDSITFTGGVTATAPSQVNLAGTTKATNSAISLGDSNTPIVLTANTTVDGNTAGNITLGGTVNGAFALTLNTTGTTTLSAVIGGTTALASITTNTGGTVAINGGAITTTGSQTYNDAATLGANTTLTTTSNGDITFASTVDGSAAGKTLTISTNGTGDTTFTGAVGATNALGNITITTDALTAAAIKLAGTLSITNGGASSITGIISDGASAASLTKAGSGTLSLSANNTYTGTTTISAGTLQISGSGLLNNGSYSGNISIASSATFRFSSSSNQTLSGVISGDGSILIDGTGELTISGSSNTLSGGMDVGTGVLKISADSAFGSTPGSFDATNITLKGGTLQITSSFTINALRGITLDTDTSSTIIIDTGVTLTYNGVMAGSGNLTKSGSGTLQLGGTNTFTGNLVVSAGVLTITNPSALGSSSGSTTINSGALVNINITDGLYWGSNIDEPLSISGTGSGNGVLVNQGNQYVTYRGLVTLQANSTVRQDGSYFIFNPTSGNAFSGSFDLTFDTNTSYIQVYDPIATGNGSLTKTGSNALYLFGDNTFTGAVTVSAGTLYAGNNNALGTTAGGVTVASGAALYLYGGVTVGAEAISVAGTFGSAYGNNIYQGVVTLTDNATIANTDGDTLFVINSSGSISGTNKNLTFSGAGVVVVDDPISLGSGSLTLSGNPIVYLQQANSFTGHIFLSGGVLAPYANDALGDSGSTNKITFQGGAVRHYSTNTSELYARFNTPTSGNAWGIDPGNFSINYNEGLGETFTGTNVGFSVFGSLGISGSNGSYSLQSASSGTVTFDTTHLYTGTTTLRGGSSTTLLLSTLPPSGRDIVVKGGILDLNSQTTDVMNSITIGGDTQNVAGSDTGQSASLPNGTIKANTYSFNPGSGTDTITAVVADGASATGIVKTGYGRTTFVANNTYSGSTTIANGYLRISKDENLGTVPGSTTANNIILAYPGTLEISDTFTLNEKRGIQVSRGSSASEVPFIAFTAGAKTLTYNGVIANGSYGSASSGGFYLYGSSSNSTLILSGTSTYTDNTVISSYGTLKLTGALSSSTDLNINSNTGILDLQVSQTLGSLIDMYGSIVRNAGVSSLTITGTSNIAGPITTSGVQLYSGDVTLKRAYGGAISTSTFTTTNSNLTFNGKVNSSGSGNITDANNLTASVGSGTVTFGDSTSDTIGATYALGVIDITGNLDLNASINNTTNRVDTSANSLTLNYGASSISVSGTADLGADIYTSGVQTFTGAVTLSANVTLSSINDGAITFGSTVDSISTTPYNLTIGGGKPAGTTYYWIDWTSWDDTTKTATGTITIGSDVINVTYT